MTKEDNKDKLRVYEYAKSLNMSSKEIITILKRLDVPVNNHMSVMENGSVNKVEQFFKDIKSNAAAKREPGTSSRPVTTTGAVTAEPQSAQNANQNQPEKQVGMNSNQNNNQSTTSPRPQSGQDSRTAQTGSTQNARPQGSTTGSRPQGSTTGSRPQGSSTTGSRPQGSTTGSRPQGSSTTGSRPQGSSTTGSRPQGSGTTGSRPQGSSTTGSRPQGSSPAGNRPPTQGAAPRTGDRPQGQGGAPRSAGPQGQGGAGGDFSKGGPKKSGATGGSRPTTGTGQRRFDDGKGGNFRGRGGKNGRGKNQQMERREKVDNTPKKIIVRGSMTVGETAKLLHKDASEVIKKLISMGVMATINQELDLDTILLLAGEFGVEVEVKIPVDEDSFETVEENDTEEELQSRPPVVTIMGHVDHGKTTLLDAIRSTNVTSGEAGGITQHIGAYQVEINHKKITFLDTPGHEAFTAMRARGAQVTDMTIIVVAADDGVMPQTVEAINHAKAAGLPIIVAVNKIDKVGADPDKVKQELTGYGLVPEEWGGDTIFVNLSAKQRTNLEELLEMILLVAEVNEYKANPDKRARGTVIEAELDKNRGPVARILVQHGTLRVGDAFVAGNCFGRVRAMVNDKGRKIKEAGPSTPVEITGLTEVPQAGDPFMAFEDERKARAIADRRAITQRQSELNVNTRVTLDDLFKHIKDGEIKDLNVIIKGDVQGSVEALKGSLAKIEVEGVRVKILHSGAGAITESDITLAAASNAIVIGFNVRPDAQTKAAADQEKVDVRLHRIIYNVIEEIEQAMKGMLDPIFKESIIGHAEVRNVFTISKVGTIAGCMVTSGKIARNAEMRLIRSGIVVFEGKIDTLKRFKDDAKEVAQGYECGITLERYNDLKEGDIIEAFIMETVER
ncbi:translation initiation factor IF-2 [Paenibacillus monticola]|uniref:Translation initiation factor IF-2 n=1 Tax=Paenibacillus monticola TaxID=2666075 RepID=A0A7X2H7E2_9BACL|nr:translation initiation factor IF-2 [Paenibacillus monticola]MRN54823.1 translation initiation factor IF-2 [Paenibacillus monticola]